MTRWLYILAFCLALLALACVGWAVDAVRYPLRGPRGRALAPTRA